MTVVNKTMLGDLSVFTILLSVLSICRGEKHSVVLNSAGNELSIVQDYSGDGNVISSALFDDSINQTGWAQLEVTTSSCGNVCTDSLQAYAAGLIEGYISHDLIVLHWHNTYQGYCQKPLSSFCQKLQKFIDTNLQWMKDMIKQEGKTNNYWYQVELYLRQIQGLQDGFSLKKSYSTDLADFNFNVDSLFLMQLSGDLEDLESALGKSDGLRVKGSGSCSALVKLLADRSDIYFAQDTWNGYNSMLRVLKKYSFQLSRGQGSQSLLPGHTMTFSSYPGVLMSGDDFYTISSGLASMETTIGNGNATLWKYVKPQDSVFENIRCMVANRLAANTIDWSVLFADFNSGTYNNQWMVLDYNKFTPGIKSLPPYTFAVIEQIPGYVEIMDQTDLLMSQGYWPSYNIPYSPKIFNLSGGVDDVNKFGDWFSYDRSPRANIFRRDQVKVKDLDSMTRLMRHNKFQTDPLSRCNCTPPYSAENAISARSDLNPASGKYPFGALGHRNHGGTDMKLTSYKMSKSLDFIAVSSPTYDDQAPFQWSKADFGNSTPHLGHPDLWVFKPLTTSWKLNNVV